MHPVQMRCGALRHDFAPLLDGLARHASRPGYGTQIAPKVGQDFARKHGSRYHALSLLQEYPALQDPLTFS